MHVHGVPPPHGFIQLLVVALQTESCVHVSSVRAVFLYDTSQMKDQGLGIGDWGFRILHVSQLVLFWGLGRRPRCGCACLFAVFSHTAVVLVSHKSTTGWVLLLEAFGGEADEES